MNTISQVWPLDDGHLVIEIETTEPLTREEIEAIGPLMDAANDYWTTLTQTDRREVHDG